MLINGVNQISKDIAMIHDERLGFLTFSPINLGSTIHITVQLELENLSKNQDKFDEIACNLNLKIKKIGNVDDENDKLYELMSEKCLGLTEFETVNVFAESIIELLDAEKSLNI